MAAKVKVAPLVVVLPSPGVGHFTPLAEFARKLHLHHHLHVTLLTTAMDPGPAQAAQQSIIDSLPPSLTTTSLPSINTSDSNIPPEIDHSMLIIYKIMLGVHQSIRRLYSLLNEEYATTPLVVLVVEMFGVHPALDLAKEFKNVQVYLFYPSNFTALSFYLNLPDIDSRFAGPFLDMPEPLWLPGCIPIPGSDFPEPANYHRESESYKRAVDYVKRYKEVAGIFVNSVAELELGAMEALKQDVTVPPIAPVGLLTHQSDKVSRSDDYCLKWLDQQPDGSVIFVSFGSGGMLSMAQTRELAMGLEMSGQRFLWAAKKPSDNQALFLPEGFTCETEGVGLVVPWWAPQLEVLAHKATGAFLSHCGWNSMIESMAHGIPIVAWPLYAEQKVNAVLAVDGMNVAIRPRVGEDGLVGREEICRVVVEIMVGEVGKVVRERMGELKGMALRAVGMDGSSDKALGEVVTRWRSQCSGQRFH